jgi:glutamine synthetase
MPPDLVGQPRSAAELAAHLTASGIVGVAISYVDNSGIARGKMFPVSRLEHAARWGIGMSPVFDVMMSDDTRAPSSRSAGPVGDLRMFPDLNQLVALGGQPGWAWAPLDRRTQEGVPHSGCQRTFARRMTERTAAQGLTAQIGFETEWTLYAGLGYDRDDPIPATTGPGYGMDRLIEVSDYCRDLLDALEAQRVEVQQLHAEHSPAQFELSVGPADPVAAADRVLLVRHTIRAVTHRAGMRCSFAPMPLGGGEGNGCHLHMSLQRDGESIMTGARGPHGLTAEAEAFGAGVLENLPALLAIGAPSVASYLRLVPHSWSGAYRCWGRENREAAMRLITDLTGASVEVKCVDCCANPYLLVGAVLALGLDGVGRALRLPLEVTVDPTTLSEEERVATGVTRLPQSLGEALEHFSTCEVLAGAMGTDLFEAIADVRRGEIARFANASEEDLVRTTRFLY